MTIRWLVLVTVVACGPSYPKSPTMKARGAAPHCEGAVDCTRMCKSGDGWACTKAGDLVVATDYPGALDLYVTACQRHDPDGCAEMAMHLADAPRKSGFAMSGDEREDVVYEACTQFKSLRACTRGVDVVKAANDYWLSRYAPDENSPMKDWAKTMHEVACTFDDLEACEKAENWARACALHSASSCDKIHDQKEQEARVAAQRAYDESPEAKAKAAAAAAEAAKAQAARDVVARAEADARESAEIKARNEQYDAQQRSKREQQKEQDARDEAQKKREAGNPAKISALVVQSRKWAADTGHTILLPTTLGRGLTYAVNYGTTASWKLWPEFEANKKYLLTIFVSSSAQNPQATLTKAGASERFTVNKADDGPWYVLQLGVEIRGTVAGAEYDAEEGEVSYTSGSDEPAMFVISPR